MDKNSLLILQKKLLELTDSEIKKRNIYLRKLLLGEIKGPLTNYASIDKPWLKHYDEDNLNSSIPKCSIFQYMDSITKEYDNLDAFEYLGNNITYKEFKEHIKEVKNSLVANGAKEGDIVSVCLPNIPEVGYVFYALNDLGCIANMLDPRTNSSTLVSSVNDARSSLLITLDSVTPKFLGANVDKIVAVSPIESLPKFKQSIIKLLKKELDVKLPIDRRIRSYEFFINSGKMIDVSNIHCYKENTPAVIAYTGGTTGVPKGVIVTNEAFNAMIVENSLGGYNVNQGDKCINIAPPWTYYGLSNCFNSYLCMGVKSILIPALGPDDLGKLIYKYKPNHVITVPSALIAVMNDKKLSKKDLSYLKTLIVGADKLDPTFEKEFNKFLDSMNSQTHIAKGYGMTEVCAATTYTKGDTNQPGTVGIPYIFENVAIFDIDNPSNELPIGERGEIAIKGPKNMIGYFGERKYETELVLKKHDDGTTWAHSGDIGHIDSDGKLYIDGRLKRMFVRNGFKIFPGEIESQIQKNPYIQQAAVVPTEDDSTGYSTTAYIVLKNNCSLSEEEIINQVNEELKNNLYDYELPDKIDIIESMPLTGMNKINYKELEKISRNSNMTLKR